MSGKMIETGSRISRKGLVGALAVAGLCMLRPATAHGQLIESFENTLDGWTFNPTYNVQQYQASFSTTTGVTNGSYSLEISSGATARTLNGADYGNMLVSPRTVALASTLSTSSSLSIDYFNPENLGYGPQIDVDLNDGAGGEVGYVSLDGYGYPTPAAGESTAIYLITPALQADLAYDAANSIGANLVIQLGGPAPATTNLPILYVDNVLANPPVPEPASLSLLALGATGLLARRRKA